MKLATSTGDFSAYVPTQELAMEYILKAGFKYMDYNFGVDANRHNGIYSDNYKDYLKQIKEHTEKLGIKLVQSHSPMGKPVADDNAQFIADTIRCVEACGAWGIPNVVIHSGYALGLTKEECFKKNKEFYMPILEAAEKYNVDILVENFNRMNKPGIFWVDNATDLLAMIEYVDHPRFHAVWDAGHANMQEMSQYDELKLLGSHVRATHIQDNKGDVDNHITPFLGSLNLDAVMNGLLAIDYKGYFTFEVGKIFSFANDRRPFPQDTRLANPTIELRLAAEKYLYALGKCVLEAYNCFEE